MPVNFDQEGGLRPKSFDDFNGQSSIVENLRVFVNAAKFRGDSLDHILLYGPPGLGKTSLSSIIASELGSNFIISSGPVLSKPADLAGILTSLEKNDVLFIDEIHRLSPIVEEYLYSAMEDFRIDIVIDKGPSSRSLQIDLNPFTLIGATTRSGLLTAPLRDRFGINFHFDYYDVDTLSSIVKRSAYILNISIDDDSAHEISRRSRGTPRIANAILRRIRDFAQVYGDNRIDIDITKKGLDALNIDSFGLNDMDRKYLSVLLFNYHCGPVGISTLSSSLGEDVGTLEEVVEPFLIKNGFIQLTPKGRVASSLAKKILNYEDYQSNQYSLF
ncbi:MAG: Holliday junction branch migration DNA helicase RuvB [Bacteroidales bacterium]|nr:Holliday junction branch migration DNA helicase RuvB [Bacteroidales bacterium]